ncbi:cytochrome d ubiquinol oxidase subunit II [Pseudomonas aeruginosa]|uniref:cytochrome d ubiquinol oxidase subunit II n=1 Tax=Pseudomonas aeruginosa TaxID=287 RepID=UPI0034D2DC4C
MTLLTFAACVVVFALAMYVLLDGFDLGVGSLLLTTDIEAERDEMIESIEPVWDGNETWLILLGVTLLAAFPLAYSTLLTAFYLPIMVMLLALGFRGVSFEFRGRATVNRRYWDYTFCAGSVVATLCQGLVLGAVLEGTPAHIVSANAGEVSGEVPIFSLYSCWAAISTVVAYAMIGSAWLNWRTKGATQQRAASQMRVAMLAFAVMVVIGIVWTLYTNSKAGQVWYENLVLSIVFAGLAIILWLASWVAVRNKPGSARFYSMVLVLLLLVGIVVTVWPYIVPYSISISDAASPSGSQQFLMTGVAIILPVVLGNAFFVYRTFRRNKPIKAEKE